MSSNSVFISYRRSANPYLALAVYQDLHINGIDTFYDIENIDAGQFDTIILNQISARVYFMPIFTPETLDRCVDSGDWVRREIEYAMNENRQIVPLHTPDFNFGDIDKFLPGLIARELKRWNAIEIPHKQFRLVMRDVRERILTLIDIPVKSVPKSDESVVALKQAQAIAVPFVTERQLGSQEYYERALISADSAQQIIDYSDAIRLNPQFAEAYYGRGDAHFIEGDLDEAIEDYNEAIRLNLRNAGALYNRGFARAETGDLDGAIEDYSEAIRLDPMDAEAYRNRAHLFAAKGDYEAAIEDSRKALKLCSDDLKAEILNDLERWSKPA